MLHGSTWNCCTNEWIMLNENTWKHLTVCKQMSSCSFKNNVTDKLFAYKSYIFEILYIYGIKLLTRVDMPWNTTKPNTMCKCKNYCDMFKEFEITVTTM